MILGFPAFAFFFLVFLFWRAIEAYCREDEERTKAERDARRGQPGGA